MAAITIRGITCIVIACFLLLAPTSEAAISCGFVISSLVPCMPYVIGNMAVPSDACCSGIKTLYNAAMATDDLQTVCSCLKGYAGELSGVNYAVVGSLPSKCGVSIPYPISPSTDCSKIS